MRTPLKSIIFPAVSLALQTLPMARFFILFHTFRNATLKKRFPITHQAINPLDLAQISLHLQVPCTTEYAAVAAVKTLHK
jgi:hypothetical protein